VLYDRRPRDADLAEPGSTLDEYAFDQLGNNEPSNVNIATAIQLFG
jgi:hypothetical protein